MARSASVLLAKMTSAVPSDRPLQYRCQEGSCLGMRRPTGARSGWDSCCRAAQQLLPAAVPQPLLLLCRSDMRAPRRATPGGQALQISPWLPLHSRPMPCPQSLGFCAVTRAAASKSSRAKDRAGWPTKCGVEPTPGGRQKPESEHTPAVKVHHVLHQGAACLEQLLHKASNHS
jgi:hypothetical protein